MFLALDYAQGYVSGGAWNPVGDLLRPFDREAVRRTQKILEHQVFELPGVFQAIGVQMDERARAAMKGENIEGRACHRFVNTESLGETLNEGRFSHA